MVEEGVLTFVAWMGRAIGGAASMRGEVGCYREKVLTSFRGCQTADAGSQVLFYLLSPSLPFGPLF